MRPEPPDPLDLRPPLEVGIHGVHRHREWDGVYSLAGDDSSGNDLQLVVMPDGSFVIEWDDPPGSYDGSTAANRFVGALTRELDPPFRARVVRRNGGFIAGVRRLTVLELPIEGDELTFRAAGAERELRVNGWPAIGGMDVLEQALDSRFREYFVFARRLSNRFWEVEVSPL